MKTVLILCFILSALPISAASTLETIIGCKAGTGLGLDEYNANLEYRLPEDSSWVMVSKERLRHITAFLSQVPFQESSRDYALSCGPITLALALELMGADRPESYWESFILNFEYFSGGVYPHVLVEHTNKQHSEHGFYLKSFGFEDFEDVKRLIHMEISAGRPVISLLVICALMQHYVNIVGFNDSKQEVLILDPDGKFKTFSYSWLQNTMYAGISKSYGTSYMAESLIAIPLFSWFTTFNYYNLFAFHPL